MTIKKILLISSKKLKNSGSNSPALDAEILLSKALAKNREYLYMNPDKKVKIRTFARFVFFVIKRIHGYSVAAIIGKKNFYGLEWKVNKNVLIPRPESEIIVSSVLEITKGDQMIVDVGCGSGCIIATIVNNIKTAGLELSRFDFAAIDISPKALKIADENFHKLNLQNNIKIYQGDLLIPLIEKIKTAHKEIIITANLPYLSKEQFKNLKTIQKEPKKALISEEGGLRHYRKLFEQIAFIQKTKANTWNIFCEIDPSQNKKIGSLAKIILPFLRSELKKDLAGLDRLFVLKSKKKKL